ncbi:hypothetical protein Snoj_27420 [Streptomyces nojiriensis]|uniref:Uncharacterized protein n=1 Tax=Streptomyces nojiriensis TaxID=66374 RepID=A0ABQ3SL62_9ACTN|nr:hypothetical protein GCM10010205_81870 [Streptomyces nojiriensis]GHI66087.1 hypothetical protein Snoj_00050 [Streptomyces nojiriensis]GHI68824.1 hypothetical protein Snoj_27420 [Streptomyces nojiriensis]
MTRIPSTPDTSVQDSSHSRALARSVVIGQSVHGAVRACSEKQVPQQGAPLGVRAGEEFLAVVLQEVEGDEVGLPLHGEGQGAAGSGGGPALQHLERQAAGLGVPDDQFAVEDQDVRQLRLGGRHQVRPPVLDERPATGLHQHRAARPGRGEQQRPVTVVLQTVWCLTRRLRRQNNR